MLPLIRAECEYDIDGRGLVIPLKGKGLFKGNISKELEYLIKMAKFRKYELFLFCFIPVCPFTTNIANIRAELSGTGELTTDKKGRSIAQIKTVNVKTKIGDATGTATNTDHNRQNERIS